MDDKKAFEKKIVCTVKTTLNDEMKQINLKFKLPILRTDGEFKLNGTIINIFPLHGDGNMFVELGNFQINILGELFIGTNGFAKITTLNLDAKFETSNLQLENLFIIERGLGEKINRIIPQVSRALLNSIY